MAADFAPSTRRNVFRALRRPARLYEGSVHVPKPYRPAELARTMGIEVEDLQVGCIIHYQCRPGIGLGGAQIDAAQGKAGSVAHVEAVGR